MSILFRTCTAVLAASALLACGKTGSDKDARPAASALVAPASAQAAGSSAGADGAASGPEEAAIRKTLAERLPNFPAVAEVRKTPMPGLFEVRVSDADIFYSDAKGDYLIQGALLDTKARKDLTKERMDVLTAIRFDALPFQDAMVTTRGKGERKLAVFEDPNCPYCHKFEADLAKVDNITVYTFLMPVLGPDSMLKSQHIWCAPDKLKAWNAWMLNKTAPQAAQCDTSALQRNLDFGHAHHITGTPALIFTNGKRVPGAIGAEEIEKLLAESK